MRAYGDRWESNIVSGMDSLVDAHICREERIEVAMNLGTAVNRRRDNGEHPDCLHWKRSVPAEPVFQAMHGHPIDKLRNWARLVIVG